MLPSVPSFNDGQYKGSPHHEGRNAVRCQERRPDKQNTDKYMSWSQKALHRYIPADEKAPVERSGIED